MKRRMAVMSVLVLATAAWYLFSPATSQARSGSAVGYKLDAIHSSIYFRILHKGLSFTYGRFNEMSGQFQVNEQDHGDTSFAFTVMAESVDTNNKKRDEHLRKPDFFNARQFPTITFQSKDIRAHDDTLHVTGDLTLHGVTNSISMKLKKVGQTEKAIGFATEFTIKRSDFGMKKLLGPVGDEVTLMISFEGTRA